MELGGSLAHSLVPATCPCPELARFIPCHHIPLLENPSECYPPIYAWVLQVVSFPKVSSPKTCIRLSSLPIRATCLAHLILLGLITRTILGEENRTRSSSLCSFLHSLVTSSFLGPNILLRTLFSNIPSLRSSLNVGDQVSHPYKTRISLYMLYIICYN